MDRRCEQNRSFRNNMHEPAMSSSERHQAAKEKARPQPSFFENFNLRVTIADLPALAPLVERASDLLFWYVPDDLLRHLAAFENQQSRNATHAIAVRGSRVLVHVHLP